MSVTENTTFKIVILGRYSVGKTSLLKRFALDKFSKSYKSTIGCDIMNRTIEYDGIPIKLQIWDTSGQEKFSDISHLYYRGADGCILMYDTSDASSFKELDFWRDQFLKHANINFPASFPFLLIGNKVDKPNREISIARAEKFCDKHNDIFYVETSAKKSFNVEHAFRILTKRIIEYNEMELKSDPEFKKSSSTIKLDASQSQTKWSCCFK